MRLAGRFCVNWITWGWGCVRVCVCVYDCVLVVAAVARDPLHFPNQSATDSTNYPHPSSFRLGLEMSGTAIG